MSIDLDIMNDALNYLGAEPINSPTEDTKQARTMSRQYPIARDYILRTHHWNFAIKRIELVPTSNTPVFGETNEFKIPNDCVRIQNVLDDNYCELKYRVEGRSIYSLGDKVSLVYVSNDTSVEYFDAEFKKAVAAQLAADSCYSITQSTSLMQGLYGLAKQFVEGARSTNSMEGTPREFKFNYFDKARITTHEIYTDDDIF